LGCAAHGKPKFNNLNSKKKPTKFHIAMAHNSRFITDYYYSWDLFARPNYSSSESNQITIVK